MTMASDNAAYQTARIKGFVQRIGELVEKHWDRNAEVAAAIFEGGKKY